MRMYVKHFGGINTRSRACFYIGEHFQGFGIMFSADNPTWDKEYYSLEIRLLWIKFWVTINKAK